MGRVTEMVPSDVGILFPTAKALLKAAFTSSREKVLGSLVSPVQVNVAGPPEVRLLGMEPKVTAETNGRKKMRLANVRLARKEYSDKETPLNLKAEYIVCERGQYKTYRKVGKWKWKVKE